MVIVKNPNWWGGPVEGPDELVYRIIRENEVRVTALLNGEIQIAQFVPPHMLGRISGASHLKLGTTDSIEPMFLAMQPKPPFDNKLVRQAVAYAIDRDAIIQGVYQGQARGQMAPSDRGTFGYIPELRPRYTYDPEKAKQLLAEAGYPNGLDVELRRGRSIRPGQTVGGGHGPDADAGRHPHPAADARVADALDGVQKGLVPFYYMGRGAINDPGLPLSQYFEPAARRGLATRIRARCPVRQGAGHVRPGRAQEGPHRAVRASSPTRLLRASSGRSMSTGAWPRTSTILPRRLLPLWAGHAGEVARPGT